MADAWEILVGNSTLPELGNDAWEHLNNQDGDGGDIPGEYIVHADGIGVSFATQTIQTSIADTSMSLTVSDNLLGVRLTSQDLRLTIDDVQLTTEVSYPEYNLDMCSPSLGDDLVVTRMTSAEILPALVCVTSNASGQIYRYDSAEVLAGQNFVGITAQEFAALETNRVYISDETVQNVSWNWDLTKLIYLADDGTLTQTPSLTGFVQTVGVPISTTSMRVRIEPPILLED